MNLLNPYVNFEGNCEEAFMFYKSVFGGEFSCMMRYEEMPPQEGMPDVPDQNKQKIMHVSLPVGGNTLMGCDVFEGCGERFICGNNISLTITADTREDADRIFNSLSKDGVIIMPMADAFWGDYFGMATDKFGVNWMIFSSKQE